MNKAGVESESGSETGGEALRAQRLRKLAELEAAGVPAYGGGVFDLVSVTEALQAFEDAERESEDAEETAPPASEVRIAGRVTAHRVMGKSAFADLRDGSGRLQVYAQRNVLGEEAYRWFRRLDLGDIITVRGTMFRTRTGEPTVRVRSFQLLSKALRPLPEKWHGLTDVEQRYRQRYLDLIANEDVRRVFRLRSAIIREIRRFLNDRGFMEVETPMLQPIPGGAAARPFETFYAALNTPMYLRIAPELYLKRLLVGGFDKVFELNRNFRNEGLSKRHNPEFTMLEAYQAYGDCRTMMNLVEEMVETVALRTLGALRVTLADGREIDLSRPWRRAAYRDLILDRMGGDWFALSREEQARKAAEQGLVVTPEMDSLDITHEVYEKLIEHTLVQPTFVTRLPARLVPLAKRCPDDPACVDVYELEIAGMEVSPGYSELNDPLEQRRRFEEQAARGLEAGAEAAGRIDEDFLVALEHGMPPAGGLGLGIDRLVMILTGMSSIRDVILFPQMRPRSKTPGTDDRGA